MIQSAKSCVLLVLFTIVATVFAHDQPKLLEECKGLCSVTVDFSKPGVGQSYLVNGAYADMSFNRVDPKVKAYFSFGTEPLNPDFSNADFSVELNTDHQRVHLYPKRARHKPEPHHNCDRPHPDTDKDHDKHHKDGKDEPHHNCHRHPDTDKHHDQDEKHHDKDEKHHKDHHGKRGQDVWIVTFVSEEPEPASSFVNIPYALNIHHFMFRQLGIMARAAAGVFMITQCFCCVLCVFIIVFSIRACVRRSQSSPKTYSAQVDEPNPFAHPNGVINHQYPPSAFVYPQQPVQGQPPMSYVYPSNPPQRQLPHPSVYPQANYPPQQPISTQEQKV